MKFYSCANVVMSGTQRGKSGLQDMMVHYQRQTLDAVNRLVDVQQQLLEVKKAKLELKLEEMVMKKAKLVSKGWFQDEAGNWIRLVREGEE